MRYIFLIFFLFSFSWATLKLADEAFQKGDYTKASKYYEQIEPKNPKILKNLFRSYVMAADHFSYSYNFEQAKEYYNKAKQYNQKLVEKKLAKLYEKEADLYNKAKKYQLALNSYKIAQKYGNSELEEKIKNIEMIVKHHQNLQNDTRKVVTQSSPQWTKAIGRLVIPTKIKMATNSGYKIDIKKCSATLVNFEELSSSRIIVTASHCLSQFDKKVGLIRFIIKSRDGKIIQKYANIYKDSQFDIKLKKNSDYAILLLSSAIQNSDVEPLKIDQRSFLQLQKEYKYQFASLGGFSSDIGDYGSELTYDPKCQISYHSKLYAKSNCSGFKGASGGPVVFIGTKNKVKVDVYFVGVVSHFKNQRYDEIYFAPHHIFYNALQKAVNRYNR